MDLNASPVPEDDEDAFEGQVEEYNAPKEEYSAPKEEYNAPKEEYNAPEEHIESAVDIARRVPFPLYSYIIFSFV